MRPVFVGQGLMTIDEHSGEIYGDDSAGPTGRIDSHAMTAAQAAKVSLQHLRPHDGRTAGYVAGKRLVWPWEGDRIRQRASGCRVASSSEKGGANAIFKKTGDASDGKN